jgi:hypothetical protein
MMLQLCLVLVSYSPITHNGRQMAKADLVTHFRCITRKDRRFVSIVGLYICEVRVYRSILFKFAMNTMPLRSFSLSTLQFPFVNNVNLVAVRTSDMMRHPQI